MGGTNLIIQPAFKLHGKKQNGIMFVWLWFGKTEKITNNPDYFTLWMWMHCFWPHSLWGDVVIVFNMISVSICFHCEFGMPLQISMDPLLFVFVWSFVNTVCVCHWQPWHQGPLRITESLFEPFGFEIMTHMVMCCVIISGMRLIRNPSSIWFHGDFIW